MVPFLQPYLPLFALLAFASCGDQLFEPAPCLARHSAFVHFQFDEDIGLPYTVQVETEEGTSTLVCEEYPSEDPYGGAVVVESDVDYLEPGSTAGYCTSEILSMRRYEEVYDVKFEVRGSGRVGIGRGTPVYRLREGTCHDYLDAEFPVVTQPIDDV